MAIDEVPGAEMMGSSSTKDTVERVNNFIDQVMETVPVSVLILDTAHRVVSANCCFYEMFAVGASEITGRVVYDLQGGEWNTPWLRQLLNEQLPELSVIDDLEIEHELGGRGERVALVSARRMRRPDGAPMVLLSFHDVTQRTRTQRELEAKGEALAAANAELEAFSYSVSHDLRAPLRAIDGFARAFAEDYGSDVDDEGRRLLNVIIKNTAKMGRLIDDLLGFSRLSRRTLRCQDVDMGALARQTFDELAASETGRNIQLEMNQIPPAWGDLAMLRQVWVNLLSNAIKYTRPRDEAYIEIAGTTCEGVARFTVRDNGVGFDDAYAHKLFGVFQRLHKEKDFEGTGVGLALVRRIVERHGGAIEGSSGDGEGAIFQFTLPLEDQTDYDR